MRKLHVIKDYKRRCLFKRYEIRKNLLKSVLYSETLSNLESNYIRYLLKKYPNDSSKVRIRNRCIMSGHGRGVLSKVALSRVSFKKIAGWGYLSGLRKI